MRLLLDTHAVLWWQTDDRRLSKPARKAIQAADVVWVSAASAWEVAIKTALGRLRLSEPFAITVASDDLTELPVLFAHADTLATLPPHHADPFDRMLVAQALVEGATLVTRDTALGAYGVPVVW
jgi:PIN domain nuclease of toxin-antitoxin system